MQTKRSPPDVLINTMRIWLNFNKNKIIVKSS